MQKCKEENKKNRVRINVGEEQIKKEREKERDRECNREETILSLYAKECC